MNTNRRDFIKKTALAAGVMSVGSLAQSCCNSAPTAAKNNVSLNLSFQEGIVPGKTLDEKLDYMEKLGIPGLEVGGGGLAGRVNEIQQALKGRNIKMSAICAGFSGWLIAENAAQRKECMDSSKEILAAGGELGSIGMILVPGFNWQQPSLQMPQAREVLVEQLKELSDFAQQHNTSVILEPLNREEAWFMRLLADAAAICKDVNSPGITCLGDFWHMTREETCDYGAFMSGGKYLSHVHMASRKRRSMPGEDGEADNYIDGFKALKELNYQHYVSFECGCQGNREEAVPAAVALLREQWEKA
ncbi:MAG: sugar phosphate isomerase/epimerase [Bacteroidales bacterium]|jgi:sugar phosphate isomerase/epimerase|nr:sugar phosphate isomerase/epimerase [Bacteroidales bacterium]